MGRTNNLSAHHSIDSMLTSFLSLDMPTVVSARRKDWQSWLSTEPNSVYQQTTTERAQMSQRSNLTTEQAKERSMLFGCVFRTGIHPSLTWFTVQLGKASSPQRIPRMMRTTTRSCSNRMAFLPTISQMW